MHLLPYRLCAILAALTITFTACAPSAPGNVETSSNSSSEELTAAAGSGAENGDTLDLLAEELPVVEVVPQPKLTQTDIDEALLEVMENYSATAVSVATVELGQLSQSGAWGWAIKNEREMTADTKLRVASLSKVAVGMCAMAMAEDGIIDLDAPLSDYWGAGAVNPYSKGQPSVRTLMSHSSSLKDLEITRGLSHLKNLLYSNSTWRSMEPGNGGYWYYSNFGICILGTTLELAANRMLDDYFQEHFCQPMGLNASFYGGNLAEEELATLYNPSRPTSLFRTPSARALPTTPVV